MVACLVYSANFGVLLLFSKNDSEFDLVNCKLGRDEREKKKFQSGSLQFVQLRHLWPGKFSRQAKFQLEISQAF